MIQRVDLAELPSSPPAGTFVVRLWHEGTANREPRQSGEGGAFLDLDSLLSFVNRFAAEQNQAGDAARADT
jgi:hypothetical protein